MARAINSLPVPVSPRTSTVESVGATRSTSPRRDSRAALVPTIWSNSRALSSSPHRSLSREPTIPPAEPLDLQRHSNGIKQGFAVERFREKFHRTASHRLQTYLFVAVCCDEDGWYRATIRVQLGLELQPRHAGHPDIGDQAAGLALLAGVQESLGGAKRLH